VIVRDSRIGCDGLHPDFTAKPVLNAKIRRFKGLLDKQALLTERGEKLRLSYPGIEVRSLTIAHPIAVWSRQREIEQVQRPRRR
jgi:hypothetical protein